MGSRAAPGRVKHYYIALEKCLKKRVAFNRRKVIFLSYGLPVNYRRHIGNQKRLEKD